MIHHRFILEPYKGMNTRYRCPSCQQRDRTFSLYIGTETGEQIHPSVGRCNRESNCGYHYTPKQYFQDNNISFDTPQFKAYKPQLITPQPNHVSFIPVKVFKASLKGHETNHFVNFLVNLFGVEIASELVSNYFIAASKRWNGATVFWQIDTQGKVRTGKIMLYNPTTGKRLKEPFDHINWAHKLIEQPEFALKQCLFGEHLLIDKTKPIAIVESEKTAVIASVYLPQFIWLAVGSLTNLNAEKCSILKGRTVTLFPDLNGFDKWSKTIKELSNLAIFTISDLLERKGSEADRKQGFDLADYLIKFDFKEFKKSKNLTKANIQKLVKVSISESENLSKVNIAKVPAEQPCAKIFDGIEPTYPLDDHEQPKPENCEQNIIELENYFTGLTLPTQPVKLNPYSTITNVSLFIESHFATLKANNCEPRRTTGNYSKRTFFPYISRLNELKRILNK